jgi:hypothetical protein
VADVLLVKLVLFCIELLLVSLVSNLRSAVQFSRVVVLDTIPTSHDLATSDGSWILFMVPCLNFMSSLLWKILLMLRT